MECICLCNRQRFFEVIDCKSAMFEISLNSSHDTEFSHCLIYSYFPETYKRTSKNIHIGKIVHI